MHDVSWQTDWHCHITNRLQTVLLCDDHTTHHDRQTHSLTYWPGPTGGCPDHKSHSHFSHLDRCCTPCLLICRGPPLLSYNLQLFSQEHTHVWIEHGIIFRNKRMCCLLINYWQAGSVLAEMAAGHQRLVWRQSGLIRLASIKTEQDNSREIRSVLLWLV